MNIASPTTGFDIFLDFYTGADTSATSANALATATDVQEEGFDIAANTVTTAGNYTFSLTFPAFTIQTGTFTVVAALTNEAGTNYTTASVANARFSLGAPTVGTSTGFVWSDADENNIFTGAEQTKFGATAATIRISITAAAVVPEPGTNAALALAGGWLVRRRRALAGN